MTTKYYKLCDLEKEKELIGIGEITSVTLLLSLSIGSSCSVNIMLILLYICQQIRWKYYGGKD